MILVSLYSITLFVGHKAVLFRILRVLASIFFDLSIISVGKDCMWEFYDLGLMACCLQLCVTLENFFNLFEMLFPYS